MVDPYLAGVAQYGHNPERAMPASEGAAMISDTLFDARADITRYLADPAFEGVYVDEMRERIERLLDEMDAVRLALDTSPTTA